MKHINKLLTRLEDSTSSELKSKDNIIHKLINQNNCEENTNRVSINQSSTKVTSDIMVKTIETIQMKIKEQVTTINKNSTPVKSNNQRSGKSKNQISKANPEKKSHIKVIADSILNVIHERHEQR